MSSCWNCPLINITSGVAISRKMARGQNLVARWIVLWPRRQSGRGPTEEIEGRSPVGLSAWKGRNYGSEMRSVTRDSAANARRVDRGETTDEASLFSRSRMGASSLSGPCPLALDRTGRSHRNRDLRNQLVCSFYRS